MNRSFIELQTTVSRANSMWDGFGNIEVMKFRDILTRRSSIRKTFVPQSPNTVPYVVTPKVFGCLLFVLFHFQSGVCSKEQSFFIPQNATIPFAYKQLSFQYSVDRDFTL